MQQHTATTCRETHATGTHSTHSNGIRELHRSTAKRREHMKKVHKSRVDKENFEEEVHINQQ
jgi:hypothetical protein